MRAVWDEPPTLNDRDRLKLQRMIARAFWVPEHMMGLKTSWWKRRWQSWRRRP